MRRLDGGMDVPPTRGRGSGRSGVQGWRWLVLTWVIASSSLAGLEAPPGADAPFRRLGLADGLSHPNVYSILRDAHGFVWFGTQDGLDRYDGYEVRFPALMEAEARPLVASDVSYLFRDSGEVFWVGTWGGGLLRFDPDTGAFRVFRHLAEDPTTLSDDRVHSVFEDREGRLWIATYRGLNLLDRQAGTFRRYLHRASDPDSLAHDRVWNLDQDAAGMLWLATDLGLDRFDPDRGEFLHHRSVSDDPTTLNHDHTRVVHIDSAGTLWVGTEQGVARRSPGQAGFVRLRHDPDDPSSLADDTVNAILEDSRGTVWIGSESGGLSRWHEPTQGFVTYRHDPMRAASLAGDDVRCLFEDDSGLLWIGSRGGGVSILDLKPQKFRTEMAGTLEGLYRAPSGGARGEWFRAGPEVGTLPHDGVQGIAEDALGRLWVGTSGGLVRLDAATGRFERPPAASRLPSERVEAVAADTSGALWVGTRGGLARLGPAGEVTLWRHDSQDAGSLSDSYVQSVLPRVEQGRVWVGTSVGGLNRLDPESGEIVAFRHDPEVPDSLSFNQISTLFEDSKARLWVGTTSGLNLMLPSGRFRRFTRDQGLPNLQIKGILEDDAGAIWVTTNGGLSRLDPEAGTFHTFAHEPGLQGRLFSAAATLRTRAGELLFGGHQGFSRVWPDRIRLNRHAPPVLLTSFEVFSRPFDLGRPLAEIDAIELTYRDTFFAFGFAALDYTNPAYNRYAYRLEGVDPDWVDAGHRRLASYTGVDPGTYLFRVRAANSDGVWNEEGLSIRVVVRPPFWQTWWLRTLAAGALLGLVWLAHRIRLRAIREHNARLEREVAERTAEVRRKNQQLQIINNTVSLINQELSFDALLQAILEGVSFVERAVWAVALVRSSDAGRFEARAAYSWTGRDPRGFAVARSQIEVDFVASMREVSPGIFVGSSAPGALAALTRTLGGEPAVAMVMTVLAEEEAIGYLIFANTTDDQAFTESDAADLENLREHVASAFIKGRLMAELHELNETKNEFLGMAAHDLRSPLGSVRSYVDLLLRMVDDGQLEPVTWRRFLTNVRTSAASMLTLINDLLDVAAIESGRIDLRLATESLGEALGRTRSLHGPAAAAKGIELEIPDCELQVLADRDRLAEVLDNLVGNAIKYTEPGGRVEVSCELADGQIWTHVDDTGQGLAPEEVERAFTGVKLSSRPTGGETSTGFGLVIVKKLVELQGGRVSVESTSGRGSRFSFSLTPGAVEARS